MSEYNNVVANKNLVDLRTFNLILNWASLN